MPSGDAYALPCFCMLQWTRKCRRSRGCNDSRVLTCHRRQKRRGVCWLKSR